jgi:PAS domain S-box-containing protein
MQKPAWLTEAFLEQSPACQWIVNPKGEFHAIYGDPSGLFGKSAKDLKGRTAHSSLFRELAETWTGRFERVLKGETLMLRDRRGNSVWFVTVFPIRYRGRIRFAGGIGREITPWNTAEHELRQTVFSAMKAQEAVRHGASKFLHDSVGQNLTALGLQLDLVRMDLTTTIPDASDRLAEIQKVLETMMEQVREYSYELNPSIVERAGLRPALDRLSSRARTRFRGTVKIETGPSLQVDSKMATALYHIAQEAVDNAIRHAACSVIEIAVKSTQHGPVLQVRDNGRGFDPGDIVGGSRGLGLLSMEQYAAQAGLELSISSNRKAGTEVRAAAPGAD